MLRISLGKAVACRAPRVSTGKIHSEMIIPAWSWSIVERIGRFVTSAIRKQTFVPEIIVHVEINGPHFSHRTDILSIRS